MGVWEPKKEQSSSNWIYIYKVHHIYIYTYTCIYICVYRDMKHVPFTDDLPCNKWWSWQTGNPGFANRRHQQQNSISQMWPSHQSHLPTRKHVYIYIHILNMMLPHVDLRTPKKSNTESEPWTSNDASSNWGGKPKLDQLLTFYNLYNPTNVKPYIVCKQGEPHDLKLIRQITHT
jgi:hypothetical protein